MQPTAIFGPFFTVILLTMVVWLYMYVRRIAFIQANDISPDDLAIPGELDRRSPPAVSNPSDNLKNLFEVPVLFYAVVLYLYAVGQVDAAHVTAAWIFAVFRVLHSAVHCTFNRVMVRFYCYLIAALALWFMVVRAAITCATLP